MYLNFIADELNFELKIRMKKQYGLYSIIIIRNTLNSNYGKLTISILFLIQSIDS
jgi:hypothetical protein